MKLPSSRPRIVSVGPETADDLLPDLLDRAQRLGFRQALVSSGALASDAIVTHYVAAARAAGLACWVDVAPIGFALNDPHVEANPSAFRVRHDLADGPLDPRQMRRPTGQASLRTASPAAAPILQMQRALLERWVAQGVSGFVLRTPDLLRLGRPASATEVAIAVDLSESGDLPDGAAPDFVLFDLPGAPEGWARTVETRAARSRIAPVIAVVADTGDMHERIRQIQLSAMIGNGMIVPASLLSDDSDLVTALTAATSLFDLDPVLSGAGPVTLQWDDGHGTAVLRRTEHGDARASERAVMALINGDTMADKTVPPSLWNRISAPFASLTSLTTSRAPDAALKAGEVRLVSMVKPARPPSSGWEEVPAQRAAKQSRVVISAVSPSVDNGTYVVKRVVGDTLKVEADIFGDGHDLLAAELVFQAEGAKTPERVRMTSLPDDCWEAEIILATMGRHLFWVDAWMDHWGSFTRDLTKKRDAGLALSLEVREGIAMVEAARQRSNGQLAKTLEAAVKAASNAPEAEAVDTMLSDSLARAMAEADDRPFLTRSFVQAIDAERVEAGFASWYELFPRSMTESSDRHGTLLDVIPRLPAIRDMGFDVLYFTPIHPIGRTNRKGRNNTLTPGPDDVGSPYAIGAAEGGHDALHPELGTLDDFRTLVEAAAEHGLELALDFAIQCSPDHPWLKQHPGWFAWRPDGSMKYAENPPKKYQDIVNVDFYGPSAVPALWDALRDVVLFWIAQGVKIFRVDNPHTKPLPFWQWMIGEVRRQHPDAIFLSEAFTRPKVMYHLAKVGFSQSYTYFTWRNAKHEMQDYLTELNTTNVRNFFRPHFFVNTPDINPYFLQTSGRPGFLIRAALATTLSGLWGMYSGFELCEAEPLPGKEEYKDSEKFEIKVRDWHAPGNIVAEITKLNAIRKAEPALQTHLGFTPYNAFNDQILTFGKQAPGETGKVLVAISFDPHHAQEADFEVPLWEWGLPDHGAVDVVDLVHGHRFTWHGKVQHIRLTPDAPYAIWKITPAGGA